MTDESETQSTNVIRFPVVPKGTLEEELPIRVFNSDRARITLTENIQRLQREKELKTRDEYTIECEVGALLWLTELVKQDEAAFIDFAAEINMIMQDSADEEWQDDEE